MKRIALSTVLVVAACNGANLNAPEPEPEVAMIRGAVLSIDGAPIADAVVTDGVSDAVTDSEGRFAIEAPLGVPVIDLHARADGWSTGHVRVPRDARSAAFNLLSMESATIDAQAGGLIESEDGLTVRFPEGSFARPDGSPVVGPVEVSWTLLNDARQIAAAPGGMRATSTGLDEFPLESFGMAEVTIRQDGEDLELTADAELSIPLAASAEFAEGESVPLWTFDEGAGIWVQEGEGIVQDGQFVAQVPHFTWWNCDIPMTVTCVRGRVMDASGLPSQGTQVVAEGMDYMGMTAGATNDDGFFEVLARIDSRIELRGQHNDPSFAAGMGVAPRVVETPVSPSDPCVDVGTIVVRDLRVDGDGHSPSNGDCDDDDPAVHPGAEEPPCTGEDLDCDGFASSVAGPDEDGDGHGACTDCDDANATVYPSAPPVCDGIVDNDCDGYPDASEADQDGDGVSPCQGDCDDLVAGDAASCYLQGVQVDARGGCGVRADGRVHCWGPCAPATSLDLYAGSVAVDESKVCFRSGGLLTCWAGSNSWTPLQSDLIGLDGFGPRMAGIDVAGAQIEFLSSTDSTTLSGADVAKLAVGASHLCVERSTGEIACDSAAFAPPADARSSLVSGDGFSCGLDGDGAALCWGPAAPVSVMPGPWQQLAAGAHHLCALDASGAISCFGDDTWGQASPPDGEYVALYAGGEVTCASTVAGIECWGRNDLGQASPFGSAQ